MMSHFCAIPRIRRRDFCGGTPFVYPNSDRHLTRPTGPGTDRGPLEPKSFHTFSQEKNMKLFKRLAKVAFVLSILVVVPACNTMHGAGKDVEKGGEKLQDAAK
jgi:predicted small secreted protein